MSYMITNDIGEPIGFEYPSYSDELDYFDDLDEDYGRDYDYEPDTTQDGFPYETDLGDEWL